MKSINDLILEETIKNSNIPILIKFWAEWCSPCKIISNILKEIENHFKWKIKIININIDFNNNSVEKFSIKNIPTIIIIKNKIIILKKQGIFKKENLKKIINKII